jgi:hypothetical protein
MTSPLDLYRTANTLVRQYGTEDALLMAAKRCDALLGRCRRAESLGGCTENG